MLEAKYNLIHTKLRLFLSVSNLHSHLRMSLLIDRDFSHIAVYVVLWPACWRKSPWSADL